MKSLPQVVPVTEILVTVRAANQSTSTWPAKSAPKPCQCPLAPILPDPSTTSDTLDLVLPSWVPWNQPLQISPLALASFFLYIFISFCFSPFFSVSTLHGLPQRLGSQFPFPILSISLRDLIQSLFARTSCNPQLCYYILDFSSEILTSICSWLLDG